uniref:Uncharacterized protein n=1 Tax=Acrobeloides nanus TaxID=290746 RepID=A0A914DUF8_9BILA
MSCQTIILFLGWSTLAYFLYKLIRNFYDILYPFVIATPKDLKQLAGANWAVVTGSTDGIGKAYALNLASRGFNIVLVSRTQSRLDDVKQEILRKSPNVEVRTIKFDFTNANLEDYKEVIVKQLNGLDVGILVNNVGMFFEYPDRFDKISGGTKYIRDLTVVNILPVTILTSEILKQMVPRNKGVVINISSSASHYTMRYINVYSATKKYVTWLTQILTKEFSDTGITFQVVNAAMVATKMSGADEALFVPSPETFAKQALNSVGHVSETNGCLVHEIQGLGLGLPNFLLDFFGDKINLDMKERAMRKK